MELEYKEDGEAAADRMEAWFLDAEHVIPHIERTAAATYWGGEAFPVVFPVSISLVAITAAYLGCPYRIMPVSFSGWASPVIQDWNKRPVLEFDPGNIWWKRTRSLLDAAAKRAAGRYCVGVPDLNGPGEILARLRDPHHLAIDLIECPEEVTKALIEINQAWLRYWEASLGTIHQWVGGYWFWMGLWSDLPATDLQCDFSCMISSRMFEKFFLPGLDQQTRWVARTIYHLDGPGAIRHLEGLLSLPHLDGIQWIPGVGAPNVSSWVRLLRRIQAAGKLLVLKCRPPEVEHLLSELEPEGLLLSTRCKSEAEARDLLVKTAAWTARKQWVVPS